MISLNHDRRRRPIDRQPPELLHRGFHGWRANLLRVDDTLRLGFDGLGFLLLNNEEHTADAHDPWACVPVGVSVSFSA